MIQVIFNTISAAEMAALPIETQLELLAEFQSLPAHGADLDLSRYGRVERDGRKLYRHRSRDYRLYFEVNGDELVVHRVLHKNTIRDFLFRVDLPLDDGDDGEDSGKFWELIEEGRNAKRASEK